ncbi:hypothetical protein, partial [Streptomyces sp. NPDC005799]|uniref:hypothetical protein n=1 Tax=Streptomyces sp. NPDC005799 TaxID=3154678 RepID=UPI0033D663CB
MPDLLQQAVHQILHGLVTELPAQLATAAITALTASALRARRRRLTARTKPTPSGHQEQETSAPLGGVPPSGVADQAGGIRRSRPELPRQMPCWGSP